MQRDRIAAELAAIQKTGGGLLMPASVVEFAKNPDTALHSQFEWDDTAAAHAHRLWQARMVIRLHVTVLAADTEPVRAFVSLSTDRGGVGGYRSTVDVMDDDINRSVMLTDALDELRRVQRKYRAVAALKKVWEALDNVAASPPVRAVG